MNKYQRAVLIAIGLAIAAIQLYGIGNDGLGESRGWAVSFLISAALLFVGLGSWEGFAFWKPKLVKPNQEPVRAPGSPIRTETELTGVKSEKYEYGIHISELDIAIEAHQGYAKKLNLYAPLEGNAKSLNWNCCASVYASMRFAARKTEMKVHNSVWNTIIKAIVVRMTVDEVKGVGMGDPGYEKLEADAYSDIERINQSVEDALAGKGSYLFEPVVNVLAMMFGSKGEAVKALSAMVGINAEAAHKKILPELLADLS